MLVLLNTFNNCVLADIGMKRDFVVETRDHIRPRLYALGIVLFIVVLLAGLATYSVFSGNWQYSDLAPDFERLTPVTLLYSGAISGLFFVPIPLELAFLGGVRAGSPVGPSLVAVIAGFLLGNLVSYLVGWKLSRYVMHLVSAKKMYGLRRKVNRFGSVVVFLVNLIPGPAPQLTFALGMARYNMARLFSWFLAGNIVKYSIISVFFV